MTDRPYRTAPSRCFSGGQDITEGVSSTEKLCDEAADLITRLSATDTEAMRQALLEARDAADEVLAPLCEKVGRYLLEANEANAVKTMHDYDVVIPFGAFKRLYDATDKDRIDALAKGGV